MTWLLILIALQLIGLLIMFAYLWVHSIVLRDLAHRIADVLRELEKKTTTKE